MPDFAPVYAELAAILKRAAEGMVVVKDSEAGVLVHAPWPHPTKPKEPMFFGGVRPGKAYVSFHLMPVYTHREIEAQVSDALRKRMQGKSCFNFKKPEPELFRELEALTRAGAAAYATPLKL